MESQGLEWTRGRPRFRTRTAPRSQLLKGWILLRSLPWSRCQRSVPFRRPQRRTPLVSLNHFTFPMLRICRTPKLIRRSTVLPHIPTHDPTRTLEPQRECHDRFPTVNHLILDPKRGPAHDPGPPTCPNPQHSPPPRLCQNATGAAGLILQQTARGSPALQNSGWKLRSH